ncbi:ATPase V0 complex subunit D [Lentinus tigrinus ALCF2SS1-7]|uniref:V-type proton ATPase subunit n=1 Tax=Lentinus tigrinus ALCF2SS1-6 TaxID=1328759 RepID=A0A5C2SGK5_9APHY|nr:ATPase V0 complex subunit D [Lentinus tigrinus ALCF2SS1-6]RPD77827.1 ATPase V0 complex subunit D [Lentinus tigrinus ALCF2SS1-7]
MEALLFNVSGGFLEGIVRGYKAGLLTQNQYNNLTQCETIEDLRTQLSATDYGNFLANEPMPISTSTISEKATQVLVDQFNFLRSNAVEPLSKFLEYMTYAYMIDNIVLVITGTLHGRNVDELLQRCHPLGMFDTLGTLGAATNGEELYHFVLRDTPLASYFRDSVSAADLDDLNIEIIRNTLYKAYLEDFDAFCETLGAPTADIMHNILSFEADRRAINITINSFGTQLSKEQRAKLFPTIGRLFPEGNNALARADDIEQVRQACEAISEYRTFFEASTGAPRANGNGAGESSANLLGDLSDELGAAADLEDRFFVHEVHLNKLAFLQQFQYAVFFSYIKLKEQEIRSLTWIAECIAQNARDRIHDFIPTF